MSDHTKLIARADNMRRTIDYAHMVGVGQAYPDTTVANMLDNLTEALKEAQANAATARQIIQELTDSDPCSFDHHGDCQAHGFFDLSPENPCGHAKAKRFLAAEASQ